MLEQDLKLLERINETRFLFLVDLDNLLCPSRTPHLSEIADVLSRFRTLRAPLYQPNPCILLRRCQRAPGSEGEGKPGVGGDVHSSLPIGPPAQPR